MMQIQNVKIINRRLPFRQISIVGAVLLLSGGAYSLWRLQTSSSTPTQPLITNKKVQIATALGYREPHGERSRNVCPKGCWTDKFTGHMRAR
jgi:hypothetical protein